MLSKNQVKYIRSLHVRKFREIHKQYIAEGVKMVGELLNSDKEIVSIYSTTDFAEKIVNKNSKKFPVEIIDKDDLKKISALSTPNEVLAIVSTDVLLWNSEEKLSKGIYLFLDSVQDPGNFGTIIRSAEWFGVKAIFCSAETADLYNPKVVQATMGSLFRVPVFYADLPVLITENNHLPSFASVLNGANIYDKNLPEHAIIIIGNESIMNC
jgi:RNA methyltransferase, TrmH family